MNNGLAFLHPQLGQDRIQPFRSEDPHQVIFQRQEEGRPTRVALTARTAAQLIVDAAAFMAFGAQNKEAASRLHGLFGAFVFGFNLRAYFVGVGFGIGGQSLHHLEFDVAAQFDVGAATGHVGGDGHRTKLACIGHDLGFLLMLAGVQHAVRDPRLFQKTREEL